MKRRRFALKFILPAGLIIAGILATSVYTVKPEQQALVLRFGRVARADVLPGLHFKLFFPIERVRKVKVAEVKRVGIGFELEDQISGRIPAPERLYYLTADRNIISVQAMVQFAVSNPVDYLFNSLDPQQLVRAAAEAALTQACSGYHVEEAITVGKYEIQEKARTLAQAMLDSYRAGARITAINLQSVGPPDEVAAAFKDVIDAQIERRRLISEAESYSRRALLIAEGEAKAIMSAAHGYQAETLNMAAGETQRFLLTLEEYKKAPGVTSRRLYLETIEEVLPRVRKMILGPHGKFTMAITGAYPAAAAPPAGAGAGE